MAKQTRGRPKGSTTQPIPVSLAPKSRCKKCNSTDRTEYTNRREHPFEGIDPDGQPYNRIVFRRTSCAGCGQHRDDKTFELVTE
ncbi:MAG: hypothetical protein ACK5Q5_24165 [Planctomycetaceae bacterium]